MLWPAAAAWCASLACCSDSASAYPHAEDLVWASTYPRWGMAYDAQGLAHDAGDLPDTVVLPIARGGRFELRRSGTRTDVLPAVVARLDEQGSPLWQVTTNRVGFLACGSETGVLACDGSRLFVVQYSSQLPGTCAPALDVETGAELWSKSVGSLWIKDGGLHWQNVDAQIVSGALVLYGDEGSTRYIEVHAPTGELLSSRVIRE